DEWFWDFGDEGTDFIQNPEYVYTDTGFFTVSLVVENNGCFNQLTFEDYIHSLAPLAGFEVTNYCEDLLYKDFINNAIGADSTFWDFGVENVETDTTSQTNPSFIFPEPGVYTVTQEVFNFTTMCSHTASVEVMVTDPSADFSLSPMEGCVPLVVNVSDLSIDADSWQWFSQNGTVSDDTLTNPTITYNEPGLFENDVTLIVTDVNECNDTFTVAEPIYVNIPEANFTSDVTTGCAPLTVSFTDLSVNNFFADVVSWNWDFGPGLGTSDLQNPSFTFENIGSYDVVLTVTDTWDCNHTITLTDYIDVTFPIAGFELDSLGCTNNDVLFESTSSGWQLNYSWDFGDSQTGAGSNPTHQYLTEGTFTACVTITDGYGCTDFTCNDIIVADPLAAFSVDSTFASCPPLPVNFTNLSINANSYLWDFGDNNAPSDFENPLYSYLTPGVFDVTLIAIRTESCRDTLLIEDLIILDGPIGEYTVSIDSTCTPAEVTFVGTSPEAYTYYWDFGEGVIDSSATPVLYDSVTYVYNSPGTFTPTLSLLNSTGCFRTLPVVSTVYVAEIDADFESSKIAVCGDDPAIAFTPLINATEPITSMEWYFENGIPASSTFTNPISNFNVPGNHDVTLITESKWCKDTIIKEDYIGVGESPVASFVMDFEEGCGPHTITFTDMSTVNSGTIDAWSWDFGDGTVSTVQNPVHVFEANLDILINLEVTTDAGCVDNYFNNATVFPLTDIDAGASPTVCIGEPVQLQGTINADTSQVDYYWEPAIGLSCTECLDPWVLNPTDTIVYTLIVIGPEGCPAEADVTVFVRPYEMPNLALPADQTICANDLVQITVGVTNNVDVLTYQWDTSALGLSCYNNCFNPVASPEVSTNYTITVTSTENCSATDSVFVTVEDLYQPFTGPDKTICEGDSIALDASFGEDPQWLIATDLTCTYCPDPIAFPNTTTTYVVSVTTTSGCLVIDTIVVNTLAADEVGAGEDFAICLGEVAELQGYGPGEISWSPDFNLNDSTLVNPTATPTSDTEYIITAVNGDCTFKDSVLVEVNTKTELESTDYLICEGEEIELSVNGFADDYEWAPSEGLSDAFVANPLASPVENIDYTVYGTLGICEPDTAFAFVEVIPAPDFVMSSTRYYLEGQTIQLDVRLLEDGNYTYQWSPAIGLSCTDCNRPSVSPTEDIVYTLTLTDEDTGCSFSQSVSVERLTSCAVDLVGVPNAFSPNDDGVNDVLRLTVSPTIPEVRKFSVYNRWGGLVFSANNQFESWDGTYKGQKLQEGVYVYFVEYVCGLDGKVLIDKGDITLVR
ncbi:MAG: PKD domain-containing protein, partial [Saprospiraceae bacterium]